MIFLRRNAISTTLSEWNHKHCMLLFKKGKSLVLNVTDNATNATNLCVLLCRSVSENSTSGTNATTLVRTHY